DRGGLQAGDPGAELGGARGAERGHVVSVRLHGDRHLVGVRGEIMAVDQDPRVRERDGGHSASLSGDGVGAGTAARPLERVWPDRSGAATGSTMPTLISSSTLTRSGSSSTTWPGAAPPTSYLPVTLYLAMGCSPSVDLYQHGPHTPEVAD